MRTGGRRRERPPGGVPGQRRTFSLGSDGSTASVGAKVSAFTGVIRAGFTSVAATPAPSSVRRSIFPSPSFDKASHSFPLAGKAYCLAAMRHLALALLLIATPAAAQDSGNKDGPAYGPQLEG